VKKKEITALVKWEPKPLVQRLDDVADQKREELAQAIRDGLLKDPVSILIAVAVSTAVSMGSYALSRAFGPKQKPQRVGQLTGNIQLQNSEQGLFIPEIYGGSPSFSPTVGANPVPQNNVNGTSEGDGGYTKTSGSGSLWNCGMSHNVQINDGDEAFIRFKIGTGYAGAGFSTTASPTNANSDFKFGIQWNPPDNSITLRHNNNQGLAGVTTWATGDEFTLELRKGRFRLYKGAAEIIPANFTFPTPTYPLWLGIAVQSTGAGMQECKVLVATDIGPAPNAGAGGVKVPAIIIWTSGLRKHETPVQQQTRGGKGHTPTETVIQVSYDLDIALMFARGPLTMTREYANADIIYNQDPQLALASGVYDSGVGADSDYTLASMPDPQEGYLKSFNRLNSVLEPVDPFDPTPPDDPTGGGGGGFGGGFQGGGAPSNIYPGSYTQLQDPTIEADIDGRFGDGSTPAYRGRAYVVHANFKLDRWQGVVPNFTGVWEHQQLKTLSQIFASFCEREGLRGSALSTGLVSFWKFDEVSGDRLDSIATNHLVPTGSIARAVGKLRYGADLESGSSQFLTVTHNASLLHGDIDFTWAGWVKLENTTSDQAVVGMWGTTGQLVFILQFDNATDKMVFWVSNNGTSAVNVLSATTMVAGTWYFIRAWHNSVSNTINIRINEGTLATTAHSTGVFGGTSNLLFGKNENAGGLFFDGVLDGWGFWKRVLSDSEASALYNGGVGLDCPFVTSSSEDFDFTSVSSAWVRGLKIEGGRYSPAAVMDSPELQAMFNYFTTEGAGKLLAYENGEEPTVVIPESDFGWVDAESEVQDVVQTIVPVVEKQASLPRLVEVKYIHPGSDWDVDMQSDQRRNTDGREVKTIEVNVTALSDEARAAAQRVLYQEYVMGTKYKFTLPWTYLYLYPGYRITTTTSDGFTYVFRLLSITSGLLLECEGVALEVQAFTQPVSSSLVPDYNPGQTVSTMTVAAYIDIPARTPAELQGILVAGCPRTNVGQAYRGFTVWYQQNDQWVSLATITGISIMGKVVSATSLSTNPAVVDNTGSIVVDLYNDGFLTSVPEADMVAGANRAVVGEMVFGFATATQDPAFPNRWTLTKLLNGQDNTADHIGDTLAGTFFVLLDDAVKFVPLPDSAINTTFALRAVTFGQSLIDAAEVNFTWKANSFKAETPATLTGVFDLSAGGHLLLDWLDETLLGQLTDDSYELIFRSAADGGGTVKRGPLTIKPIDLQRISGTPPLKAFQPDVSYLPTTRYTYLDPGGFFSTQSDTEWDVSPLKAYVESESPVKIAGGFMLEVQVPEDPISNNLFPSLIGIELASVARNVATIKAGWTKHGSINPDVIIPQGAPIGKIYHMVKGDRFTLVVQPDGTVAYYINYLGAISDPWYVSGTALDLTAEYSVRFINVPYTTGLGGSLRIVNIKNARWLRNMPEYIYTGEQQKQDNSGSLPSTIHVGVRKKSAHPLGPPSAWKYASFTRP